MTLLLVVVTLLGAALLYFSDRQQRLLALPLPPAARLGGLLMTLGGLAGWAAHWGVGVGLFTGLWVFALGSMVLPMLVGHLVDGYRAQGRPRS
ncbi:hypothetical protein [Alloalcanivorax balearicus]|uniref:hypothetical protein n=1 Tax=Alloalcanivorax balearicus TaxID=413232 RepID=UPI0013D7C3E8|nr:hypothetical protein [Alloalcanivorax balearicus]